MPPRPGRPRQARRPTGAASCGSGWPGTPSSRSSTGRPPSGPSSGPSSRPTDSTHFIYLLGWWADPWVNLTGPGTSPARPVRAGGRARRPGPGAGLGRPRGSSPASMSGCHDAAVDAINRLPNCHAQQDERPALAKSHHQKLLVVQGRGRPRGAVRRGRRQRRPRPRPAAAARVIPGRPPGRRLDGGSSGGSGPQGSGNPLHDVHARLTGPTALPLLRVFLRRWWARSGDRAIDRRAPLRGDFLAPRARPHRQPVRPGRRDLQRRAAAARRRRQQPGGDRPGHLAALDPRCPPVHLHGGAVPDQRLRGRGDPSRAAPAGSRHDPDPAVGDHRHARRVGPAPGLHRAASRRATRMRANCTSTPGRPASGAVRTGQRAALSTCTPRWR